MTDPQAILAGVLDVHRWKSMGVSSVQCECGEILYGPDLTQFSADEAFRSHVATVQAAALAEWLQTFRDQRLDDRDIFCPECADNGLAVLADEFGATP